jgi:hypothetical protein
MITIDICANTAQDNFNDLAVSLAGVEGDV